MTPTPVHARRPSVAVALTAVAAVALLALASCGTVRASFRTDRALQRAGFTGAKVSTHHENGVATVVVSYRGDVTSRAELVNAAGIVWRNFDLRFDEVDVEAGNVSGRFTRSDLQERFGPRPAGFDKRSVGSDVARTGVTVAVVGAVAGILFLIVVAVAVALIVHYANKRKRERQREAALAPPPAWGPPGPGGPPFNPPVSGIGGPGWPPPPPGSGQWPPQQGG